VFLIVLIISEFGGAIWALISPVKFENEMAKAMEVSFSNYTTNKDVAEKWKSLQKQVIFPSAYYKLSAIFNIIIFKTTTTKIHSTTITD
jgi:hypothetical protein